MNYAELTKARLDTPPRGDAYEFASRGYKFKSEPMRIGKTWWRLVVVRGTYSPVVTDFEFYRRSGAALNNCWYESSEHPRYNHNDGMYAGLPKGLVKLYHKHKHEYERIKNAAA